MRRAVGAVAVVGVRPTVDEVLHHGPQAIGYLIADSWRGAPSPRRPSARSMSSWLHPKPYSELAAAPSVTVSSQSSS